MFKMTNLHEFDKESLECAYYIHYFMVIDLYHLTSYTNFKKNKKNIHFYNKETKHQNITSKNAFIISLFRRNMLLSTMFSLDKLFESREIWSHLLKSASITTQTYEGHDTIQSCKDQNYSIDIQYEPII